MKVTNNSIRRMLSVGAIVVAASLTAAQASSPTLLVVLKEENALAIFDPATGKLLGRVPTGEAPHEVIASSDGKLAFVSNHGEQTPGSNISVIDVASEKELRRIEIGPLSRPHGLLVARGRLYFTAEGYKLIGTYDLTSNKIDWLLGTGQNRTHMMALSKDGNKIFTSNIRSGNVTAIELEGTPPDWNVSVIPVGTAPEAIDMSPDGREVWTATSGDISIIDVATKKIIQTINVQTKRANRLKFTPDGKRVLLSDIKGTDLLVFDAVAHKEIKRIKLGNGPAGILVAPDGSLAYVAISNEKYIAIIDLKSLEVAGRISTGSGPDGMAWAETR